MNAKQYLYHVTCWFFSKYSFLRKPVKTISIVLFPVISFLPIDQKLKSKIRSRFYIKAYLVVFILLFVANGLWSAINGRLLPDEDSLTTQFLEDQTNLLNYLIICPLYVVLGLLFMNKYHLLEKDLRASGLLKEKGMKLKFNPSKYWYNIGFFVLLGGSMLVEAYYANGLTVNATVKYWFMKDGPPNVTYGAHGFYYYFTNYVLLLLVLWVALSYFGFVSKMGTVSRGIKKVFKKYTIEELQDSRWSDEDSVKKLLMPISKLLLVLKAFVFVLILNAVLWNLNQQNEGVAYVLMVTVLIVFGIWLFNLPRYFVQYYVYMIWKKIGRLEYKNFNIPWIMGLSSLLDIILFSILLKVLLGDFFASLAENLLG